MTNMTKPARYHMCRLPPALIIAFSFPMVDRSSSPAPPKDVSYGANAASSTRAETPKPTRTTDRPAGDAPRGRRRRTISSSMRFCDWTSPSMS